MTQEHDSTLETLVGGFWRQVKERPSSPAMHTLAAGRYQPVTWELFGKAVTRISSFLIDRGVKEHDFVAIWSNNRVEWHVSDMAILSTRCRPVPVYLTVSGDQAEYILNHSESTAIFVENDALLAELMEVRSRVHSLKTIVVFSHTSDDPLPEGVVTWDEALKAGDAATSKTKEERERRIDHITLEDFATLIYTSGTTGPPKAVCLTHENVSAAQREIASVITSSPDDRILSYLPLAHIAERDVSEFRSYLTGCQVYFLDEFPKLAERLKEVKPTQFLGVPRVWEKMADQIRKKVGSATGVQGSIGSWALAVGAAWAKEKLAGREPGAWLSWQHGLANTLVYSKIKEGLGFTDTKVFASGAAPISVDVLSFFYGIGIEVVEVYGQTENTAICSMNHPGSAKLGTVGQPFPGVEVKIADDGEIIVRGEVVFHEYYKEPAATAETIIDGWLHTGDIGELTDGYLRITDRKKDLIITAGGKNISPSNIELALALNPLIGHAVAIGDKRPYMAALITLDPEEAHAWAKAHNIEVNGTLDRLLTNDDLRKTIQTQVDSVNDSLNHAEQVKKWVLLDKDFAIGDELTPTLKVKRKVVNEKYAKEIESMYAGHAAAD